MAKIIRRHTVVKLLQGNYEAELADLLDRAMAAQRAEESGAVKRRAGLRSKATALAIEYDQKRDAAEAMAEVTVWAVRHDVWDELADSYPPREDEAADKANGFDTKSLLRALVPLSLVAPDDPAHDGPVVDLVDRLSVRGRELLDELSLSRVHYRKVEAAAWNVNAGDDSLPKLSLVSLFRGASEPDSKPQPDSE